VKEVKEVNEVKDWIEAEKKKKTKKKSAKKVKQTVFVDGSPSKIDLGAPPTDFDGEMKAILAMLSDTAQGKIKAFQEQLRGENSTLKIHVSTTMTELTLQRTKNEEQQLLLADCETKSAADRKKIADLEAELKSAKETPPPPPISLTEVTRLQGVSEVNANLRATNRNLNTQNSQLHAKLTQEMHQRKFAEETVEHHKQVCGPLASQLSTVQSQRDALLGMLYDFRPKLDAFRMLMDSVMGAHYSMPASES
jgi:hypothetical protein